MKLLSPIQDDNDIVNKKYVDDKVAELGAPIIDVNVLPEITTSTRNNIYRLNDNLYYAKPVYTTSNISVGDNLSNAKIEFNFPNTELDITNNLNILVGSSQEYKIYCEITGYSNAYIIDYIGTTSQDSSIDNVDLVGDKQIKIKGALNVEEIYSYVNGNLVLNYHGVTVLSSDFGYVSEINSASLMQYIKKVVGTSYVWTKVGESSKEIAIQNETPNEEVLWIDPEEDNVDVEDIINQLGLEVTYVTQTDTNLNDYTMSGAYYFSSANTPINIPIGVNGWLIVLRSHRNADSNVKQIWFRAGTMNTNDYMTYIRTYNSPAWSDWHKVITEDDLYYKPGDSFNLTVNTICAGHVTSSTTAIMFELPIPKYLRSDVNSVTCTSGTLVVRGISGYVENSYTVPIDLSTSTYSKSCTQQRDTRIVRITVTKSSALTNVTNNTPVSVYAINLVLNFS